jgi:glucan-binding YG repeat protein
MKKLFITTILLGTMLLSVGASAAVDNNFTGWGVTKDNKWQYYQNGKLPSTGFIQVDNKVYFIDSLGNMATGFFNYRGETYYAADNGKIVEGWKYINNKWYYFGVGGHMLTGTVTLDDGKTYNLASDGHLI